MMNQEVSDIIISSKVIDRLKTLVFAAREFWFINSEFSHWYPAICAHVRNEI